MPTPPAAQGAPTWSSSSDGATSSASGSPSCSSDPSSSSPSPSSSPSSSSSPPHATPSSDSRGTSSPPPPPPSCAACKHQRRRCWPHCPLKPYFVADDPDKFRNALQMFGIKNLHSMLRAVPPPRRDACVRTIVYESNVRAADPVRGCCGVIQDLENQLMDTAVELEVLRRRLESYRRQMARGSQPPNNPLEKQQQLMMARTSDDDMQKQGPDGVSPAANELITTPPQLPSAMEMEPESSQVQLQLSTMRP